MPLVITDNTPGDDLITQVIQSRSTKKSNLHPYTPSNTFHSDINGRGGSRGRLNNTVTPLVDSVQLTPGVRSLGAKHSQHQGDTHLVSVPVGIPTTQTWGVISSLGLAINQLVPDASTMFDMSDDIVYTADNTVEHALFFDMVPEVINVRKVTDYDNKGQAKHTYTTSLLYRSVFLLVHPDDLNDNGLPTVDELPVYTTANIDQRDPSVKSYMCYSWSYLPAQAELFEKRKTFLQRDFNVLSYLTDQGEFEHIFSGAEYKAYDRVCDLAEVVRTEAMVDTVWSIISQLADALATKHYDIAARNLTINAMAQELRRLDGFEIPLPAYSKLYAKIMSLSDKDLATLLIKQNMQLNLNNNLQELNNKRSQLSVPGQPDPNSNYVIDPRFSAQQTKAITTQEPLVIVQAGAGTGKSTTINERLSYLEACGVPQDKMMVLSFTNAAADNIKNLHSGVSSWTISGMIHNTYTRNFPKQQVSTLKTIINSIPIFYGQQASSSNFLLKFTQLLRDILRDGSNSNMTRLSVFTERYLDQVVEVLDTVGQTTLELEIIISYLKIDDANFVEPFNSPDYIIIDEVQDNSSFEFVFALRYAAKHNCNLYLVGDSSQTLYEFRSADPKALNALEGSGVFTPYRLTTNYRSNQEILDFANIHLKDIEANQYAQIQLRANSLDMPTAQSFTKKVSVLPVEAPTQVSFLKTLESNISRPEVLTFIKENLDKDEPTAFLCPTRKQVKVVQAFLEANYPKVQLANLVSDRSYDTTTFSKYIAEHWDEVTAVDPSMAAMVFTTQIRKRLHEIDPTTAKYPNAFKDRLANWWSENQRVVLGYLNLYNSKKASQPDAARTEFFDSLRQNIMDFEIRNNSIQQSLTHNRNRKRKENQAKMNPKFFVSTIHGVKGLEFDNTIVLHPPMRNGMTEDAKRQFYVAFTRAKKRELIIVGEGRTDSQLILDYKSMVEALKQRDAQVAQDADVDVEAAELEFYTGQYLEDTALTYIADIDDNPDALSWRDADYRDSACAHLLVEDVCEDTDTNTNTEEGGDT